MIKNNWLEIYHNISFNYNILFNYYLKDKIPKTFGIYNNYFNLFPNPDNMVDLI